MKHEELANERDRADLAEAAQLCADGRALRRRVLARLRARAFRLSGHGMKREQETALETTGANPQES